MRGPAGLFLFRWFLLFFRALWNLTGRVRGRWEVVVVRVRRGLVLLGDFDLLWAVKVWEACKFPTNKRTPACGRGFGFQVVAGWAARVRQYRA